MKKILKTCSLIGLALATATISSCGGGESYAKLLDEESKSVNRFLADHVVVDEIPENSDFKVGADAPYYVLDDEQGIFMQVLDKGDMNDRAVYNQEIYIRYNAATLTDYTSMDALSWNGNAENLSTGNLSFRYDNYTLSSSAQWGTGIQQPLHYLGIGCKVNLVVKSVAGPTSSQSQCIPYLFEISYYKSQLTN